MSYRISLKVAQVLRLEKIDGGIDEVQFGFLNSYCFMGMCWFKNRYFSHFYMLV